MCTAYKFCREKYLSNSALNDMNDLREMFREYLVSTGFVQSSKGVEVEKERCGINTGQTSVSANINLLRCALAAGFGDVVRVSRHLEKNPIKRESKNKGGKGNDEVGVVQLRQRDQQQVLLHQASLMCRSAPEILDHCQQVSKDNGRGSAHMEGQCGAFHHCRDAHLVYV